ncbi:hypothetical protein AHAS_Ahas09G0101700 [Arachis hypogaea]
MRLAVTPQVQVFLFLIPYSLTIQHCPSPSSPTISQVYDDLLCICFYLQQTKTNTHHHHDYQVFDNISNHGDRIMAKAIHAYAIKHDISPDGFLTSGTIDLYAAAGKVPFAQRLFHQLHSRALIDLYAKSSFLRNASTIFDAVVHLDTVSWTALISGYVRAGLLQDALQVFDKMQIVGCSPDQVVFVTVLKALVNLGKLDDACKLF